MTRRTEPANSGEPDKGKRPYGSGSVYRYKSRWAAAMRYADGTRRTLYADSETAAKRKLAQLARGELGPAHRRSGPLTLGSWLATWIETIAPRRCRPQTVTRYALDAQRWTAALGRTRLADLTPSTVLRTLGLWQREGLSAGSCHNARACLRTALNAAIREGHLARNAAALAQVATPERARYATITPELAGRILQALAGTPCELPATVALATGLRQGELLGLRWTDLDLDAASLTVRVQLQRRARAYQLAPLKTARSRRTLPLPQVAVEALRRRRTQQTEERLRAGAHWQETLPGLVWTTPSGAPRHSAVLLHQLQRALAAAGIERLRWHDLRHGAASLLLTQGVAARVVMEQLGHTQIGTTMNLYSGVAPQLLRDAADGIDRALRPQDTG